MEDSAHNIARLFTGWKNAIQGGGIIRMQDYSAFPWLAKVSDFQVWCNPSTNTQLEKLRDSANNQPEPFRTTQLEWINTGSVGTFIGIGVGKLYHGYPMLTHFGYAPDPLWDQFDDTNAFATISDKYHVSLAIVGGINLEDERVFVQEDLQYVVKRFFQLRSTPDQRPHELLWLKQVWKNCDGQRTQTRTAVNSKSVPIVSFDLDTLKRLLASEVIEPRFFMKIPCGEQEHVAVSNAVTKFHMRDTERIAKAHDFRTRKTPTEEEATPFTLVSKVFEGLGDGDELRELCFYLTDRLEYKHSIHYRARIAHSGAFIHDHWRWHLSRQESGEIYHLTFGQVTQECDVLENEESLRIFAEQILLHCPSFPFATDLPPTRVLTDNEHTFRREMIANLPMLKCKLLECQSRGTVNVDKFSKDIKWTLCSQPIHRYLRFMSNILEVGSLKDNRIVFRADQTPGLLVVLPCNDVMLKDPVG
jgi:hypothetical protein